MIMEVEYAVPSTCRMSPSFDKQNSWLPIVENDTALNLARVNSEQSVVSSAFWTLITSLLNLHKTIQRRHGAWSTVKML